MEQDKPIEISHGIDILKNAIEQLNKLDKSLKKVIYDEEETRNLNLAKDMDLVKVLDGIVYNVEITNKLWDVKELANNIQIGFNNLLCTQYHWNRRAIMYSKYNDDSQAEFYWDIHSKSVLLPSEQKIDLENELKEDISILESLEKLLIILQEQMKFLEIEKENIDKITYSEIKCQIDGEYEDLLSILNSMINKAKQVIMSEKKTVMIKRYQSVSFVKQLTDKWVESIYKILKLIFEVNMKSEIELKLKMILNWSGIFNKYEEETKQSQVFPVQNSIYGKKFSLWRIPIQHYK